MLLTDEERRSIQARSKLQIKFLQERKGDLPEIRVLKRAIQTELREYRQRRYEWSSVLRQLLTVQDGDSLVVQNWKWWARSFRMTETTVQGITKDPHSANGSEIFRFLLTLVITPEELREMHDALLRGDGYPGVPESIVIEFNHCRFCKGVTLGFLRHYFMTMEELDQERKEYLAERAYRSDERAARRFVELEEMISLDETT